MGLDYHLERTVHIQAGPETVFRFFTDSARWAKWWGAGSTIEPHPGGKIYVRHPGGIESLGEVIELVPPERIVFTYGFASGSPFPPGGSKVTIRLESEPGGTRLSLLHELPDQSSRDHHVQGWRFQLSLFGNVVADEVFAAAGQLVDGWFEAWAVAEEGLRGEAFARIAEPGVQFRDRFSLLDGLEDLSAHAGAAQRFMPGIRMRRKGDVRQCQGVVMADWVAAGEDGQERMSGTNVFVLGSEGRIRSATGFMNAK